jgi:hypothetical protein
MSHHLANARTNTPMSGKQSVIPGLMMQMQRRHCRAL